MIIVNGFQPFNFYHKALHHRCFSGPRSASDHGKCIEDHLGERLTVSLGESLSECAGEIHQGTQWGTHQGISWRMPPNNFHLFNYVMPNRNFYTSCASGYLSRTA